MNGMFNSNIVCGIILVGIFLSIMMLFLFVFWISL